MRRRAFVLLALLCANESWALDPKLTIDQYQRRHWTSEQVWSEVAAMTQTSDGWMWMAGTLGAGKFDGKKLMHDGLIREVATSSIASTILATRDGCVWIGYRLGGLLRACAETVSKFGVADGVPDGGVHALAEDRAGTIWVGTDAGVGRLLNGSWETIGGWSFAEGGVYGAFIARDDTLWLATRDAIVSVDVTRTVTRVADNFPSSFSRKHFAQTPDGTIWMSAQGAGITRVGHTGPSWFPDKSIGALVVDRDGSLWMAGDAIRRLPHTTRGFDLSAAEAEGILQEFRREDGLGGDTVTAVFEDRFGSMWAATNAGVVRFSDTVMVKPTLPHDIRLWGSQTIIDAGDGTIWIAASGAPAILRYDDGRLTTRLAAPVMTAATRTANGTVWFGGPAGLARIAGNALTMEASPSAGRGRDVQAMTSDGSGGLWVSFDGAGVYRFRNGVWSYNGGLAGLPNSAATAAATTSAGEVWLGYLHDRLARVSKDGVDLYSAADGLKVGNILTIKETPTALWIGGEVGLSMFDGDHFHAFELLGCPSDHAVSGIAESGGGDLYILRGTGLAIVKEILRESSNAKAGSKLKCAVNYGSTMLMGRVQSLGPTPSMLLTGDGRFWIATSEGPRWAYSESLRNVDYVKQPDSNATAIVPQAEITELLWHTYEDYGRVTQSSYSPRLRWLRFNGGKRTLPLGEIPKLAPHSRDVFIRFTAPMQKTENVGFRMRLLGFSEAWQSLATQSDRTALFTNLDPGKYRFEVRAHIHQDTDDAPVASLDFEILPTFYQTTWFRTVCALAFLIAIALVFRFQLKRAGMRLRERIEARMFERERIARDLHDTLLQGVQGLIMKIHAAASQMPERNPARGTLEQALDAAQSVLVEGRDRVTSLRAHDEVGRNLETEIARLSAPLAADSGIAFQIVNHGTTRQLHPIVREEAILIVREAMLNAFKHANATRIGVDIHFERNALRVVVTDDGHGIPAHILATGGRERHWGFAGMRERTQRIRGTLQIKARENGGTCVELRVRAGVAYKSNALSLSRLFSSRATDDKTPLQDQEQP